MLRNRKRESMHGSADVEQQASVESEKTTELLRKMRLVKSAVLADSDVFDANSPLLGLGSLFRCSSAAVPARLELGIVRV